MLYQSIAGRRVMVEGRFSLEGGEVGFEVGAYDHRHPLVIDPTIVYSTYLGGSGDDVGWGIAVDGSGAAYVTGSTTSTNFPILAPPAPTPFQGSNAAGYDAFVTKLNAAGSAVYSTYLGGTADDIGEAIAVDGAGAAYVTGQTSSGDFPKFPASSPLPFQSTYMGSFDSFVTKLNATGSALTYSTYLGGSGNDSGNGIAVDATGAAYVAGYTTSTNFPTQVPFQGSNAGSTDAFLTKLNATGSALAYSSYLGGTGDDAGNGIAIDGSGAAYVAGDTNSSFFPTQAPFQGSLAGSSDAFATKVNATGSALTYSTYLGGSGADIGEAIDVDGSGAAYLTGGTGSTNFPNFPTSAPLPFQTANAGADDAFVTKLGATGSTLAYSTYLGGSGGDSGTGISVDGSGRAYVTGFTGSSNFPMQTPIPGQGTYAGADDGFVTNLNTTGSGPLLYSTYLHGSSSDYSLGVAVDGSGAAYVTGYTYSFDFPTQVPFQGSNAGGSTDAFVTKLGPAAPPATCADQPVTIQVASPGLTTMGTNGVDVIRGTSGLDKIYGLGGNDIICGLSGVDLLYGGASADTLFGDAGKDALTGGASKDVLYGGADNDELLGGIHLDKLYGGANRDTLLGDAGPDTLAGGPGDDNLVGGPGDDSLLGNPGVDYLNGGPDTDICDGGPGSDVGPGCESNTSLP
jgi:Ca2+-binding RTX toxin-like protein